MASAKRKRRQLYVDKNVQGGLMLRIAGYWLFCLLTVSLMVSCWTVLTGPRAPAAVVFGGLLTTYAPALVASLLLLPIVLIDSNRFSNRFVGPILRFRRALAELAEGREVSPIKFRDKDHWLDIADSFNTLLVRIQPKPGVAEPTELPVMEPEAVDEDVADLEPAGAC